MMLMMMTAAYPDQGSGPAERYTWPSSYPSTRLDLWIRIHQCVVMMMTALITVHFY